MKLNIKIIILLSSCFFNACNQSPQGQKSFNDPDTQQTVQNISTPTIENQPEPKSEINIPLENSTNRVTKKPFGIKILPASSPVQPEKFSGYHTGVDFETFENEKNEEVSVSAICTGKILQKKTAQGYGGVLIQSCSLENQPVTVIYGHLKLTSVDRQINDNLTVGEKFALLGEGFSSETDGERKHLHLGIKKETQVDISGYVQNETQLNNWLDFQELLENKSF